MDEQQIIILVERAQAGDHDAFGELVEQFQATVFGTVLRRLRNRSEACEVSQDVFVQAFRKLSQLREPERFAGWLRQIAVRMSINRAIRRPHEAIFSPETFNSFQSTPETALDSLLKSEQARELRGGLNKLGEVDRQTLIAFYFEGQSIKQMSDAAKRPIGTIKRRLHTARNRLRDQLFETQPA